MNPGEPQPDLLPAMPDPPDFLGELGRTEWHRVGAELMRLRLLSVCDLTTFGLYCAAVEKWRVAEGLLAEMAKCDPAGHALTVVGRNGLTANPLLKIAHDSGRDANRYGQEFGLSPAARSRLDAGPYGNVGDNPAKFGGLLAAGGQTDG